MMKEQSTPTPPPCESCTNRSHSIFCSLNLIELQDLSATKKHKSYKKGETIFFEDKYPKGLFCIYEGKVKIHKLGDNGKEQIVRFAKKGSLIGYRSLLSDEKYFASATALSPTTVCFFPREGFMEIIQKSEKLSMQAIKLLTMDLRSAEEKIAAMAHKEVKERMAEAILMIKECYGYEEDQKTINAVLTRKEFGNIAGTTVETSIRVISDLIKEGILGSKGRKIQILDLPQLIRIAGITD